MIKNILTQIWNQRRTNSWLFAELVIVFVLLWFCVDVLYGLAFARLHPKGYDQENVYKVTVKSRDDQFVKMQNADSISLFWLKPLTEVIKNFKQYPGVESVCTSFGTDAYSNSTMFQGYHVDGDTANVFTSNIRYVDAEYIKTFRIPMLHRIHKNLKDEDWNAINNVNPAIVSAELADSLWGTTNVLGKKFSDYYSPNLHYKVIAVSAPQKNSDYNRYEPYIMTPYPEYIYKSQSIPSIYIRVKADVDNNEFANSFMKTMSARIHIAPFYIFDIQSMKYCKQLDDARQGVTQEVNNTILMMSFFAFNVFLGLLGTFWFRTNSRRGEIAIRMAMGSSRKQIAVHFFTEGILLLAIVFLPAAIIALNIWNEDLTVTMHADATVLRLITTLIITFILMSVITLIGIWIPSKRAMNILPADALHEE